MARRKTAGMNTITAKQIRSQLGEVISEVAYGHQHYVITRRNKPAVVMMSVREYEALLDAVDTIAEQVDPEFQSSLLKGLKEFHAKRGKTLGSDSEIHEFFQNLRE